MFASALARDDLSMVYQPLRLISASPNDEADYFEALLRVKEVSPITFLDRFTAEDYFKLDPWVAEQVQELPSCHRYAINISPWSFCNRGFIESLLRSEHHFVLELTEHLALSLAQNDLLAVICAQFPVMLDDIGSGHSGLNRLFDFNFKGIKIDGHLVLQVEKSSKARTIVGGLMRIAQDLQICCVCEYVETLAVWECLREIHDQYAPELELYVQGWAVGMPVAIQKEARSSE